MNKKQSNILSDIAGFIVQGKLLEAIYLADVAISDSPNEDWELVVTIIRSSCKKFVFQKIEQCAIEVVRLKNLRHTIDEAFGTDIPGESEPMFRLQQGIVQDQREYTEDAEFARLIVLAKTLDSFDEKIDDQSDLLEHFSNQVSKL